MYSKCVIEFIFCSCILQFECRVSMSLGKSSKVLEFSPQISWPSKVLENYFCPWKSWKFHDVVLECIYYFVCTVQNLKYDLSTSAATSKLYASLDLEERLTELISYVVLCSVTYLHNFLNSLTGLWIRFVSLCHISVCLDSFLRVYFVLITCCITVTWWGGLVELKPDL